MALQKALPTKFGIDANYWIVESYHNNQGTKVGRIVLGGYVSKEARESKVEAMDRFFYNVGPVDFDRVFGTGSLDVLDMNPVKACYLFIKELDPKFKDAVDT